MSVLTLDYRPRRFSEVVGQAHVKVVLQAMVKSDDVAPSLIFSGVRGTGKTTAARVLAAALNCEGSVEGDACAECDNCQLVHGMGSDSVLEIDAATHGGVAEINKVKEIALYSHSGAWRVILIDEAHSLSRDAFNALLKVLEEPPPKTVFVLLTTEADKILETVRSRSMTFEFRRIPVTQISSRLYDIAEAESLEAESSLIDAIAKESQGGMRDAVMLLDQCRRAQVHNAEDFVELLGLKNISIPLLRAAMSRDLATGTELIEDYFSYSGDAHRLIADLTRLVLDCLVLRSGGNIDVPESSRPHVAELSHQADDASLTKAIRILWDLPDKVKASADDPRNVISLAFVMLGEIFVPATSTATKNPKKPITKVETRLGFSEVEAVLREQIGVA